MASEYRPNFGVIPLTASATLNADGYAGRLVTISAAAGLTITLPPATGSGAMYEIAVITTVTSNSYIIQVTGDDVMTGAIGLTTDIAGTVIPTASTTDTITMNGGTTGGLRGSRVRLQDIAADTWALSGNLICTGTEATPFSAAVS